MILDVPWTRIWGTLFNAVQPSGVQRRPLDSGTPKGPGLGQMPELLFTETDLHKSTLVDLLMSIYDIQGVMS